MRVAHVFEPASSGRAKCRGCGARIAAGELRFGESLPNPFADGEMTHWFHVGCAAYRRPEPFLDALEAATPLLDDGERLMADAKLGIAHPRVVRIAGAERAVSARAQCRACRTKIDKDVWRIALVFYEDGRFVPAGFIHVACAQSYFGTSDVLARVKHFSPGLSEEDVKELGAEIERSLPQT